MMCKKGQHWSVLRVFYKIKCQYIIKEHSQNCDERKVRDPYIFIPCKFSLAYKVKKKGIQK